MYKKETVVCPICGSTNVARYLFGLPAYYDELQEELQEKPNKVADERCKEVGY